MEKICRVVGKLELGKISKVKVLRDTINHFKKDKIESCKYGSISYGMCHVISERLKKFKRCYGVTQGTIDMYIPEFSLNNARIICDKYEIEGFRDHIYWFGYENFDSRIAFLEALIKEIKNK
jgi:hypothetical protein